MQDEQDPQPREQSPYYPKAPLALPEVVQVEGAIESASEGMFKIDGPGLISMMAFSAAETMGRGKKNFHVEIGTLLELSARQINGINAAFREKDMEAAGKHAAELVFNVLVIGACLEQETATDDAHGVFVSRLDSMLLLTVEQP